MQFITNQPNVSREEALEVLFSNKERIALDIETVSLDNRLPLGIAIAISANIGYYFFNVRDALLHQLVDNIPLVIIQNVKFDLPQLWGLGYTVKDYDDTKLLAYSAGILENSLASLSSTLLLRECPSVTSQWKKKNQGNIAIDHIVMGGISIIHACNTYLLWERLPRTPLYEEIDKPCIELIMEMEEWGLLIDQHKLTEVEQDAITKVKALEEVLRAELGDINFDSNPQAAKALQDKGIVGTRKTKSGKDAVSKEALEPLHHPIADKFLERKSIMKTLSTYVPAFRNVDTYGRIHTDFGNTDTGRWKSRKPNLQNITRDEKFKEEED